MKMYVFPRDDIADPLNTDGAPRGFDFALDAAIIRLGAFMLAWTAGAAAAAFIAF